MKMPIVRGDPTASNPNKIDKRQARLAFEKAAQSYDKAAAVQQEIARRNLERLDYIKLKPTRVLDIGAGTGQCSFALAKRYPKAKIIALDIAHNMTKIIHSRLSFWQQIRKPIHCICADAESLPLANASVDLIFSNLTLQWCTDLERTFQEFRRVLTPNGLLMFTTFGPDTLKELRHAWASVDETSHVNTFLDMHDVGDALMRVKFSDPVMDMEYLTATYPNVHAIMRELKNMGAHNVIQSRVRGLTGKQHLQNMLSAYEQFRTDGVLPVSYEVIYGIAWMSGDGGTPIPGEDLSTISLEQLRAILANKSK